MLRGKQDTKILSPSSFQKKLPVHNTLFAWSKVNTVFYFIWTFVYNIKQSRLTIPKVKKEGFEVLFVYITAHMTHAALVSKIFHPTKHYTAIYCKSLKTCFIVSLSGATTLAFINQPTLMHNHLLLLTECLFLVTLSGATRNLMRYSRVNQPTKMASVTRKK